SSQPFSHFFELPVSKIPEQELAFCKGNVDGEVIDLRIDVPSRDEQVFPAVIVKVKKTGSPAQEFPARKGNTHIVADIAKDSIAGVAIECAVVVREVRDIEIKKAVMVVVSHGDTHSRLSFAILVIGSAG